MLIPFKKLNTMGVINVTPNSFSDPNKFFLSSDLSAALKALGPNKSIILDFGFESTAPMNTSIAAAEERRRFELFFDQIKDIDLRERWISFDTYRVDSFRAFESCFKGHYKTQGLIFNDVSGVIDSDLEILLREKKEDPLFRYIYSYTHIPSRELTGMHMTFIQEGDILEKAVSHFKKAEELFRSWGVDSQVIFDPCFGFSKTYEQNWTLIHKLNELRAYFENDRSWLIGLSKKSFLRQSLPPKTLDLFHAAEKLHEELIEKILNESNSHTLFRVHDFDIVERVLQNKGKVHA